MSNRLEILSFGILFLFFLQLISEFVEAIYAFGLLGTSIPLEIVSVLFLFAPFVLVFLPERLLGKRLAVAGILVLGAGVAGMLLDTRGRMLVTGFGTACFLVYFPSLLGEHAQKGDHQAPARSGSGMALGLALFMLFRAWNSGVYPYNWLWFRMIAAALAVAGVVILLIQSRPDAVNETERLEEQPIAGRFGKTVALSLGIFAALTLLYFAFSSPNVIARWADVNYPLVLGSTSAALGLFALGMHVTAMTQRLLKPGILAAWNLIFLVSMMAAILPHQISFPRNPGAYPLPEPAANPLTFPALILMALLFPVILVDFMLLTKELIAVRPNHRILGAAFGFGSLFLLVMIIGQVFTTVYDYIPVAGPFFRDRFWLVFLVSGLVMALPLLRVRWDGADQWIALPKGYAAAIISLGMAAFIGAVLTAAKPVSLPEGQNELRVLTYNIQQGYSEHGSRNAPGQLELMQRMNADIIGLQESDTNRIAGGNADVVRYLADRLDMHSYYGPKVIPGTFGIALLSKYPIENPRTFYMYSQGEQTATIHAQVNVGGRRFNIFVTHLGNSGPIVQQEAFLKEVNGMENVIAMGDFNFRPESEQYELTLSRLDDAWLVKWPSGKDEEEHNPSQRIDHIFLSPGMRVREARYITGPESDHPAFIVELEW